MDDQQQGRERGGRLDELPAHEDDSDVAGELGGGVMDSGGTSEVRGTGDRTGNGQGLDDEATGGTRGTGQSDPLDETPGIRDVTDADWEPGDGAAGSRSPRFEDR
jgi:hypothetical protein